MPSQQLTNPTGAFGQTPDYATVTVTCLNADSVAVTEGQVLKIAASNSPNSPGGMIPAFKLATTTVADDALLFGFAGETIEPGSYGQVIIGGIVSAVADEAMSVGNPVMQSITTAGRVQAQPTLAVGNQIGYCLNTPSAAGSPAVVFVTKF